MNTLTKKKKNAPQDLPLGKDTTRISKQILMECVWEGVSKRVTVMCMWMCMWMSENKKQYPLLKAVLVVICKLLPSRLC